MNVPNLLSCFRMILTPFFAAAFFSGGADGQARAVIIFLLAGVTDVIDGRVARKYNQITLLGRILDPLADKLMVLTALVCCTVRGVIPVWAVALYAGKELCQGVCGFILFRKIKDVPPSNAQGKLGAFLFYVTIACNLVFDLRPGIKYTMLGVSLACIFSAFASYIIRGIGTARAFAGKGEPS